MLRNLYMQNSWPPRPTRFCRKRTLPGLSSLMAMAVTSITGKVMGQDKRISRISAKRFIST